MRRSLSTWTVSIWAIVRPIQITPRLPLGKTIARMVLLASVGISSSFATAAELEPGINASLGILAKSASVLYQQQASTPRPVAAKAPRAEIVSAKNIYVPGVIEPITAFGAKCDWNGTTGTDDTQAWKDAWAAIHTYPSGGTIIIPACFSYVPNGLNFSTNSPNYEATYVIRGQGATASAIVTKNAVVGLDLGGVNNVHLEDFKLTDAGSTAKVGVARYRVAMSGGNYGGGTHTYRNLNISGSYSVAGLYSVGSENNTHYNLRITQVGAGAGLAISSQNCLDLTGQGQPIPASSSDTVNQFFGGVIGTAGKSTGGAVMFCRGSADDVTFNGTYFVSYAGYDVRFGKNPRDGVQGTKSFHSVRFEGNTDAISFLCDEADSVTIDSGSTFGEVAPGIDLNWLSTDPVHGFNMADIHGNSHLGRGLAIPVIINSRIEATSLYGGPPTTIKVNGGISESMVEANAFSLGSSAYVSGSVLIQNDGKSTTGSKKIIYGPNPGSPNQQAGSAVVMQPFSTAPESPLVGELAVADGVKWQPGGVKSLTLVMWNGTQWVPVGH